MNINTNDENQNINGTIFINLAFNEDNDKSPQERLQSFLDNLEDEENRIFNTHSIYYSIEADTFHDNSLKKYSYDYNKIIRIEKMQSGTVLTYNYCYYHYYNNMYKNIKFYYLENIHQQTMHK